MSTSNSSRLDGSRDGRYLSALDVPSDSSRRRRSQDYSKRDSSGQLSSSYREERYVSVQSRELAVASGEEADRRRRHSTLEIPLRSRRSSRSPAHIDLSAEYRYAPLDPDVKRAIRVLRVRPELIQGLIACEVEHTTTESKYLALSYSWGSASDENKDILLNGRRFSVRRNLLLFLDHAKEFHADKAIWVDAICINQTDIPEKNRQVRMMSRIYSETKEVFVWLGPRVEYSGHAIRRMKAFEEMNDAEMAISSAKDSDFWKGFSAINSARYWDRVWVIQEFVKPKDGRIIQGDRWVSFDTFQSTIKRFENQIYRKILQYAVFGSRRNEDFKDYISKIHPLWQMRIERSKSSHPEEEEAKWTKLSGSRFCTNIRDRVYGIMALATHGNSLRVDYDLNPLQLLLESIWLEHDTNMDRTELLQNLATILMLTPASICMYAEEVSSSARKYLKMLPTDARKKHQNAASSHSKEDDWWLAASNGREIEWHNFARTQSLSIPKGLLQFPSRDQCPWQMFTHTSTGKGNVGLKLAIDSRSVPDKKGRTVDSSFKASGELSKEEFMDLNHKRALAYGVYKTTCAPFPLKIYYALVEGLVDLGKDNKAFWALDGLEELDF